MHLGFEEKKRYWDVIAGISIGLCAYAYSTFRLLSVLHVAVALINYHQRENRNQLIIFVISSVIALLPLAAYLFSVGENLTARFNLISIFNSHEGDASEKLVTVIRNYLGYFSAEFLLLSGDPNSRHHTGVGGELLVSSSIFLLVAIVALIKVGGRYSYLLGSYALIAPVGAALTIDPYHSLRAFSLLPLILMLSAEGADFLYSRRNRIAVWLLILLGIAQSSYYVLDYFVRYPVATTQAFESFGFKESLLLASNVAGRHVAIADTGNQLYVARQYYLNLYEHISPGNVSIVRGTSFQCDDSIILYDPSKRLPRSSDLPELSQFAVIQAQCPPSCDQDLAHPYCH
jgi:hypothetical protein